MLSITEKQISQTSKKYKVLKRKRQEIKEMVGAWNNEPIQGKRKIIQNVRDKVVESNLNYIVGTTYVGCIQLLKKMHIDKYDCLARLTRLHKRFEIEKIIQKIDVLPKDIIPLISVYVY